MELKSERKKKKKGDNANRHDGSNQHDRKVERLLRSPGDLLFPGQLRPAQSPIVRDDRDLFARRARGRSLTALRRIGAGDIFDRAEDGGGDDLLRWPHKGREGGAKSKIATHCCSWA